MDSVGQLRSGLLQQLMRQPQLAAPLLERLWPRLVAAPLSLHTRPVRFDAGLLTVEVEEQGWLRELEPLRERLRGRLNQALGTGTVKAIRLVLRPQPR
ncbi:MAG TPA: DUF721 domain-containing protein [Acidobacteriota bacterium]